MAAIMFGLFWIAFLPWHILGAGTPWRWRIRRQQPTFWHGRHRPPGVCALGSRM